MAPIAANFGVVEVKLRSRLSRLRIRVEGSTDPPTRSHREQLSSAIVATAATFDWPMWTALTEWWDYCVLIINQS